MSQESRPKTTPNADASAPVADAGAPQEPEIAPAATDASQAPANEQDASDAEAPRAETVADGSSSDSSVPADGELENLEPNQIQELLSKAAKADEHWERLVRLTADFDNFKKRAARERQDAIRFANEGLIHKLLPVADNFEMALQAADSAASDSGDALKTGVNMIHTQLKNVLAEAGVEEIDARGQTFDPNWHDAVSEQETADVEEGCVVQQIRKGYKLRDRLLRPAAVVVAKHPSA